MKKLLLLFMFAIIGCTELIDKPKNLLPKEKMSQIIAEMAINDQLNTYLPPTNMENATRYVLKKHQVNAAAFNDSYTYYIATGDLDDILSEAQKLLLKKDPAAEDYINKKMKDNKNIPVFAR